MLKGFLENIFKAKGVCLFLELFKNQGVYWFNTNLGGLSEKNLVILISPFSSCQLLSTAEIPRV